MGSVSVPARTVGDVMTPAPAVLHVTHSLRAAQRIFGDKGFQHLPVVQGGRLVGILSDRDVSSFLNGRPQGADLEVALAMTRNPVSVSPTTAVEDAADLLIRHSIHSLPVVEDGGQLVGIVTASDLLRVLIGLIAEKQRTTRAAKHESDQP
jgi:acetoin utilization protein AcuB